MKEGLSYDDVLLVPKKASVGSRGEVDTSVSLGEIDLEIPVISSPMDSVTGTEMAQEMGNSGGVGVVHRFCSIEKQSEMVSEVGGVVGAAVGASSEGIGPRSAELIRAGADFLCLDVAHAHMEKAIKATESLSSAYPETMIMAGTVATYMGAKELSMAGADVVRVGVGPGSSCTTREVAGVGVPQISAIQDASKVSGATVVADGGIRKAGDIVKAIMAGADGVVVGGLLGACNESLAPSVRDVRQGGTSFEKKKIRGMASLKAQKEFDPDGEFYIEGGEYTVAVFGPVSQRMERFEKGIRSGISYCGADNIKDARDNAEFIKVTPNTIGRNGIHSP